MKPCRRLEGIQNGHLSAHYVLTGERPAGEGLAGDRSNRCINHHESWAAIRLLAVNERYSHAVICGRIIAPATYDKVKISARPSQVSNRPVNPVSR